MPKRAITVLLPDDEAERFEAYCERHGFKKSTLIARLVRDHLDAEGFGPREVRRFRERNTRYGAPREAQPAEERGVGQS